MKKEHVLILAKLAIATVAVSATGTINLHLVYMGFYTGWFPALYFPVMLGIAIFGITIYFLTKGSLWKRLLITLFGSLILTAIWFFVFMMATILITGVGGELITIKSP
jgi:hypothetical protein